jgi:Barstar (barnase inhibitor)
MAVFGQDEDRTLDWSILRDGGISLYRNRKYLGEDMKWLELQGYRVFSVDCAAWTSHDALHKSLEEWLSFPAYYGRNFHALRDCLSDLEVSDDGGLALVLNSYDVYARGLGATNQKTGTHDAQTVLHILAETSRYFLLRGRRFITLVQSDDPSMSFEGLGGVATQWNRREWLNKDRGLA